MLNPMTPLVLAAVGALAFCIAVIVGNLKNKAAVLAFAVGVSGALVGIQVLQVHVFTITVVLWIVFSNRRFDSRSMRHIVVLLVAAAILAVTALIGDLVGSPTLALQLLGLAGSASLIIAFSTDSDRRNMIRGLLAFATLSSVLGLLQVVKIAPVEIWHASVSAIGRPIGLYSEPDWLGLFAGLGLIIAWRSSLTPKLRTVAISANGAAFILAFARAAWVAVAVSIVLVIIIGIIRGREQKVPGTGRLAAVGLLILGTLGVLMFVPQLVSDLTTRLANTLTPGASGPDISGQARVNQINSLIELAQSAPFYGHGLSASGRVRVFGGIDTAHGGNSVSSNWILGMWVDGAFLAIPIIAVFVIVAVQLARTLPGQMLLVVLLNSMFSNAFFFPITWLLIALCMSELVQRRRVKMDETHRPLGIAIESNQGAAH
jgi:hypothetical protein